MKQIVIFWLLIFGCFYLGNAQDATLKHTVSGNETLLEIAKIYDVSVEEIQKLNPDVINGVKEKDILIIPKKLVISNESATYIVKPGDTKYSLAHRFGITIANLENQNPQIVSGLRSGEVLQINKGQEIVSPTQKATSYIVKNGDTKFGLAKEFGISIEKLEQMNPQIVPTLMVGQTLLLSGINSISDETTKETSVVPRVEVSNDEVEKNPIVELESNSKEIIQEKVISEPKTAQFRSSSFTSHTIQPGETLYGLSKSAGMSIEEFLDLNPKLATSVQAGMVIKIPSANTSAVKGTSFQETGNVKSTSKYTDLKQTLITNQKKNLIFLLPFSENDFAEDKINGDNLNDYVRDNRDFFRGALIAIDSAKSLGLNFDLDIISIASAKLSSDLLKIAENANINSSDAVILPYYLKSLQSLASSLTEFNITVVTTLSSSEDKETPNLFEAVPSVNVQRKTMLDYLSSKNDGNLIVLNDESRTESRAFIIANSPEAKFLQVKENGAFNSKELVEVLQKNSKNYVVLDTDKNGVFISATNALLRELSNYQIQLVVLESSLIPDEDDVSRKRFVILDMLYPSFTKVNSYVCQRTFKELYKRQYSIDPATMSVYGFDITFDTLLRLFQSEDFESVSKKITEYNTLKFQYLKNEWGYYSNFGVNIFQYETNDIHRQVK